MTGKFQKQSKNLRLLRLGADNREDSKCQADQSTKEEGHNSRQEMERRQDANRESHPGQACRGEFGLYAPALKPRTLPNHAKWRDVAL